MLHSIKFLKISKPFYKISKNFEKSLNIFLEYLLILFFVFIITVLKNIEKMTKFDMHIIIFYIYFNINRKIHIVKKVVNMTVSDSQTKLAIFIGRWAPIH